MHNSFHKSVQNLILACLFLCIKKLYFSLCKFWLSAIVNAIFLWQIDFFRDLFSLANILNCQRQTVKCIFLRIFLQRPTLTCEYEINFFGHIHHHLLYIWSCSKHNLCRCQFFGHVIMLTFIVVKIFRSCSNQNLFILFWSCELASK